jgi:peroxiredoxin
MERLKVGDKAPGLAADSVSMGPFKLSASKGKERVFIVFARYFGCSLCQLDFKELIEHAKEIQKYAKLVFVTQSVEESAKNYVKGKNATFPIIADPKEPYPLYKAYGIGDWAPEDIPKVLVRVAKAKAQGIQHGAYEGNEKQRPASFIISKDGTIEYAHYGPLELGEAMEVLRKKQQ